MTEEKTLLEQLRSEGDTTLAEFTSKGNGTTTCYQVQARISKGCGPREFQFKHSRMPIMLTDTKWETLYFPEGECGVKKTKHFEEYAVHGFCSYTAAQALRWWFLAELPQVAFVETRLLEHKFQYSYSATPIRSVCLIDPAQREDILPDWGKKEEAK